MSDPIELKDLLLNEGLAKLKAWRQANGYYDHTQAARTRPPYHLGAFIETEAGPILPPPFSGTEYRRGHDGAWELVDARKARPTS